MQRLESSFELRRGFSGRSCNISSARGTSRICFRQTFGTPRRRAVSTRAQDQQKEDIYYATFPLVGMESLEGAIVFSGRELPNILAQHCAIIVERSTEQVSHVLLGMPFYCKGQKLTI